MSDFKLGRQGNLTINKLVETGKPESFIAWFWCPGCEHPHAFYLPRWSFDECYARPTFYPSLLNQTSDSVCHLFLREGKLRFLADCTHALAGQVVDLPEPPYEI